VRVVAASLAVAVLAAFTAGSGSGWQPPTEVPGGEIGDIAVNTKGAAVAVWAQRGPDGGLVVSYRPAGSHRWPSPRKLDLRLAAAPESRVAIDDRGDAVVVWERFTGSDRRLLAATRAAGGAWESQLLTPAG